MCVCMCVSLSFSPVLCCTLATMSAHVCRVRLRMCVTTDGVLNDVSSSLDLFFSSDSPLIHAHVHTRNHNTHMNSTHVHTLSLPPPSLSSSPLHLFSLSFFLSHSHAWTQTYSGCHLVGMHRCVTASDSAGALSLFTHTCLISTLTSSHAYPPPPPPFTHKYTRRHLVAIHGGMTSGFEVVHGLLDHVMVLLDIPRDALTGYSVKEASDGAFFDGRSPLLCGAGSPLLCHPLGDPYILWLNDVCCSVKVCYCVQMAPPLMASHLYLVGDTFSPWLTHVSYSVKEAFDGTLFDGKPPRLCHLVDKSSSSWLDHVCCSSGKPQIAVWWQVSITVPQFVTYKVGDIHVSVTSLVWWRVLCDVLCSQSCRMSCALSLALEGYCPSVWKVTVQVCPSVCVAATVNCRVFIVYINIESIFLDEWQWVSFQMYRFF